MRAARAIKNTAGAAWRSENGATVQATCHGALSTFSSSSLSLKLPFTELATDINMKNLAILMATFDI